MSKLNSLEELFAGRHFDREVIILCVRWYLRYKLSFRDLVEMMAERGLNLAHRTTLRSLRRYSPVRQALESLWPDRWPLVSMRPMSRYAATGPAYIERRIRLDRGSTSGSGG